MATASPVGFDTPVRFAFSNADTFRDRSREDLLRLKAHSPDGHVNILVLSGGAAGGAFGAGALIGLTRSGKRPTFQMVTGVSVGALIAPLAFLGPEWDGTLAQALSGDSGAGLLERHLFGALFGTSMYSGKPLRDLVDRFATDDMIAAVARESRAGRWLLVETTDLDKGEPVIWDMGAIAQRGDEAARKLFRDVLVASASIPFVFPPVMIKVMQNGQTYEEMHVDGGTTFELFLAPPVAALVTKDAPKIDGINVYVIANTQLGPFPTQTSPKALSMLASGFNTNLAAGVRSSLSLAYDVAEAYGMRFQLTSIPDGYSYGGSLDFDRVHVRALFDFAERCAEEGHLWNSLGEQYRRAMSAHAPGAGGSAECPAGSRSNE